MIWDPPLLAAIFRRRYKRFFADIEINGKVEVAHVPNTGSLLGCLTEGAECRVRMQTAPERKLKYTLELIKTPSSWVGVNTANPPKLINELLAQKSIAHWQKFNSWQAEVAISKETRLDLVLWNDSDNLGELTKKSRLPYEVLIQKPDAHFVEIKNVTLADNGCALFPDCETTRGQKHLHELMHLAERGHSAEMVYVIQRSDCTRFAPAQHLDPVYSDLFYQAQKLGVRITPFNCSFTESSLTISL